ncbi:MAG: hypothetical protein WCK49_03985 [Myxococcaceae bacterium]
MAVALLKPLVSSVSADLCSGPHPVATVLAPARFADASYTANSLGVVLSPEQQKVVASASAAVVSQVESACSSNTMSDFLLDTSKNQNLQQSLGALIDAIWPVSDTANNPISPGQAVPARFIVLRHSPELTMSNLALKAAGLLGSNLSGSFLAGVSQLQDTPIPISELNTTLKQILGIQS